MGTVISQKVPNAALLTATTATPTFIPALATLMLLRGLRLVLLQLPAAAALARALALQMALFAARRTVTRMIQRAGITMTLALHAVEGAVLVLHHATHTLTLRLQLRVVRQRYFVL